MDSYTIFRQNGAPVSPKKGEPRALGNSTAQSARIDR